MVAVFALVLLWSWLLIERSNDELTAREKLSLLLGDCRMGGCCGL